MKSNIEAQQRVITKISRMVLRLRQQNGIELTSKSLQKTSWVQEQNRLHAGNIDFYMDILYGNIDYYEDRLLYGQPKME